MTPAVPIADVVDRLAPLIDRLATRSEHTRAVMEAWDEDIQTHAVELAGAWCLFVDYFGTGPFLYGAPLCMASEPHADAAFVASMRWIEDRYGVAGAAVYTPPTWAQRLDPRAYEVVAMWPEYVYDRAALAALEGTKLRSRRAEIRRFQRRVAAVAAPIDNTTVAACKELVDQYEARAAGDDHPEQWPIPIRGSAQLPSLEQLKRRELRASRRYLDMVAANRCDVRGVAILVAGQVRGFSITSPIRGNPVTEAAVLCEKTSRDIPGMSSFTFWWSAAHLVGDVESINAGDTFGDPGLETNKASFAPRELRDGFLVVRRPA